MAYRPVLSTKIEALGAEFIFVAASNAEGRLAEFVQRRGKTVDGTARVEFDNNFVPAELVEIMCDFFVQSVKAWEGVEGEDGRPLPCTIQNKEAIPTEDKVEIITAYMNFTQELNEKKISGDAAPITSTAPQEE